MTEASEVVQKTSSGLMHKPLFNGGLASVVLMVIWLSVSHMLVIHYGHMH